LDRFDCLSGEEMSHGRGLASTCRVEMHTGRPPGENPADRVGASVAYKIKQAHKLTVAVEDADSIVIRKPCQEVCH
jgi:hypothetical protein